MKIDKKTAEFIYEVFSLGLGSSFSKNDKIDVYNALTRIQCCCEEKFSGRLSFLESKKQAYVEWLMSLGINEKKK